MAQLALKRIIPSPCKKQYTAVILMPQVPPLKSLMSLYDSVALKYGQHTKVFIVVFGTLFVIIFFFPYDDLHIKCSCFADIVSHCWNCIISSEVVEIF